MRSTMRSTEIAVTGSPQRSQCRTPSRAQRSRTYSSTSAIDATVCRMPPRVVRWSMETVGGSGVMRELPIEMYRRKAYNKLQSDGGIIMKKLKVMRQMNIEADIKPD